MKKNTTKNQDQTRRLSLNRETLRLLNDPALLELARGGRPQPTITLETVESTSQVSIAPQC